MYEKHGVSGYYSSHAADYDNPHKSSVAQLLNMVHVSGETGIDLCCGNGLITMLLPHINWLGVDPFMNDQYEKATGKKCIKSPIKDIISGRTSLPMCDVVVCSYAIDIIEQSYLQPMMFVLSNVSNTFITIRPNKKEIQNNAWSLTEKIKVRKTYLCKYDRLT